MNEKINQLLQDVKMPNIIKSVSLLLDSGSEDYYSFLVSINSHNTGKIPFVELCDFCEQIYSDWYYKMRTMPINELKKAQAIDVLILKRSKFLHPTNLTGREIFNIFSGTYLNYFKTNSIRPMFISYNPNTNLNSFVQININVLSGFQLKEFKKEIKIYLNLKAEVILTFVKEYIEKSTTEGVLSNIKFTDRDDRNDDVIIYTNYENLEKTIKIIKEIRRNFDYIFENSENMGLMVGKIEGFLGFGEEKYIDESYNLNRAKVLENCVKRTKIQSLKKILFKNKDVVSLKNGKTLNYFEFAIHLIKAITIKEIEKELVGLTSKKDEETESKSGQIEHLYDILNKIKNNYEQFEKEFARQRNLLIESFTNHSQFNLKIDLETDNAGVVINSNYNFRSKFFYIIADAEDKINIEELDTLTCDRIINQKLFLTKNTRIKLEKDKTANIDTFIKSLIYRIAILHLKQTLKNDDKYTPFECGNIEKILHELTAKTIEGKEIIDDMLFDFKRQIFLEDDVNLKLLNKYQIDLPINCNIIELVLKLLKIDINQIKEELTNGLIIKTLEDNNISEKYFAISSQSVVLK